jgi:sulfate permease, SulP family
MSEWRTFKAELRAPRSDVAVLLTTFLLTVIVDLTVAIQAGMVLAAFLFMKRMAEVANISMISRELSDDQTVGPDSADWRRRIPNGVVVYEINGPFFFGAAEKFRDTFTDLYGKPKVLILRMRNVLSLDSTGLNVIKDVVRRSRKEHTLVLLSEVHSQPLIALGRSDLLDEIGEDNLVGSIEAALQRAHEHLGTTEKAAAPPSTPTAAVPHH